ncbi:GNAT family N-acetyltransferase [Companilactobacillus allii]|uniref:GNAT family N-acetyltransferase n=1 Tax=Companilactobacillus allii TaxID=1847728 RepID=A0A1P8Q267_9LACO|nr:GNAT family N-acetyltransferase [Companilactobacillus allii]APX71879.1 GNAT family N-acetyltransferase [Companilactobacillus allii]USQ68970.1 GNAT family N-acetyltransferase [Companilactobacillus allii]
MSSIYLRQAKADDLKRVIEIINGEKSALLVRGVNQWQQGYPDEEILKQDIEEGINYVLILDGEIVGTAALQQGYDKSYQSISGSWSDESEVTYSIIHRIAVESGHQGEKLTTALIQQLLTISYYLGYHDIRIDTHPDNRVMQHVITDNRFIERGNITLDIDQGIRKAYQIILK